MRSNTGRARRRAPCPTTGTLLDGPLDVRVTLCVCRPARRPLLDAKSWCVKSGRCTPLKSSQMPSRQERCKVERDAAERAPAQAEAAGAAGAAAAPANVNVNPLGDWRTQRKTHAPPPVPAATAEATAPRPPPVPIRAPPAGPHPPPPPPPPPPTSWRATSRRRPARSARPTSAMKRYLCWKREPCGGRGSTTARGVSDTERM